MDLLALVREVAPQVRAMVDAMLEHAVMHPIRHRVQLEALMGRAIDRAGIQFQILNRSKGLFFVASRYTYFDNGAATGSQHHQTHDAFAIGLAPAFTHAHIT